MFRPTLLAGLLLAGCLAAQENPFEAPPELQAFARKTTLHHTGVRPKLQALLEAVYRPQDQGGLGMTYDNTYTRTVAEAWRDRKGNCLTMTAFYVAAAKAIEMKVQYAEALNTNRWRRVGPVVRFERHVVTLVQIPPAEDLVADFLPQLRRRMGVYRVEVLPEKRMRALFYANRAVELLDVGDLDQALKLARTSIEVDPQLSVGWNIQGVVEKTSGQPEAAERSFRTALKLEPRDSTSLGNMETLLRETGRLEEAATLREQAQEIRKHDPYFNAFLAEESMAEGDLEEALNRINVAIKIQPHDPDFYLARARIHLLAGKTDAAMKAIQEAQKRDQPAERARYDDKMAAIRDLQASGKK